MKRIVVILFVLIFGYSLAVSHAKDRAPVAESKFVELAGIAQWPSSLVYNQGNLGSTVANALAFTIRYLSKLQGNRLDPSRLFMYYNARYLEHLLDPSGGVDPNVDSGTSVIGAILALEKFGCCPESMSPGG